MVLTKKQKEKSRIVKLREKKRKGGEKESTEKWSEVLCKWGKELYDELKQKEIDEKEKTLDSFVFRGKKFFFYNPNKKIEVEECQ